MWLDTDTTGIDHPLVVACGLTQILAEGSGCRWGGGGGELVFRSFRQYLGQATGHHQWVIKTCTSRLKRHIPFQTPIQSKLNLLSVFILGALNNIFHNSTDVSWYRSLACSVVVASALFSHGHQSLYVVDLESTRSIERLHTTSSLLFVLNNPPSYIHVFSGE